MVNIINKILSVTLQSTQIYAVTIYELEMNSVHQYIFQNRLRTPWYFDYFCFDICFPAVQALITKVL